MEHKTRLPDEVKKIPDEVIRQARSADLEQYCRQQGYELHREGSNYRIKDHGGLLIQGKMWYNASQRTGGNALDFVTKIEGKSFRDAIEALTGKGIAEPIKVHNKIIKKETFDKIQLPYFSRDMRKTFAYLIFTRGINKTIVQDMVKEKKIAESVEFYVKENEANRLVRDGKLKPEEVKNQKTLKKLINEGILKEYSTLHNACFFGKDENGKIKYAMERSTLSNSSFKKDVAGSDKSYNFCIEGKSDRLILCESAIEVLSVATLERMHGKSYKNDHKLSCGGVTDQALQKYLQLNPQIKKIIVGFNKDPEGTKSKENVEKAIDTIYEKYGNDYQIERIEPCIANDWNDVVRLYNKKGIKKEAPAVFIGKLLGEYKMNIHYDRNRDIPHPEMKM